MTTEVFRRLDEALGDVPRVGVVHVGAHRGEEVPDYQRAGFESITLVEPNPDLQSHLVQLAQVTFGVTVHFCAAGQEGRAVLHRTTWSERASLLTPRDYDTVDVVTVEVQPLSELQKGCNVAVLDCQGSELDVLRTGTLYEFDALIVECDNRRRYDGAAVAAEIDDFLVNQGWHATGAYGGHSSPHLRDVVWKR